MIDTHAHLDNEQILPNITDIAQRAQNQGVKNIIIPNVDIHTIDNVLMLQDKYTNYCYAMCGLHPCHVKSDYNQQLQTLKVYLKKHKFCAIGEIGLDLYWDKSLKYEQIAALKVQMDWAQEYQLPVALHTRNATDEVLDIVKDYNVKGVFHCFSGTYEQAIKVMDMGYYLGMGGVVTFKNSGLDILLAKIGINNVVLETDSPYLAPIPHRGKTNEPSYLTFVAQKIADILQIPIEEVVNTTSHNAKLLFDLPH
ncbi:MAG: TatD family hydrolase [Cytophagales bacterium]|nr:TatD family hydrolase [Cytophagales bacterium]